jgi:hypothetical protein
MPDRHINGDCFRRVPWLGSCGANSGALPN